MTALGSFWRSGVIVRAILLSLASTSAILLTILFGLYLWPERLADDLQNVIWLASGVNLAGLLLLGRRYWPVLLLNALPLWLLTGEALEMCLLAALSNAAEAWIGATVILKLGRFKKGFQTLRSVASLIIASLIAPLAHIALIPTYVALVSGGSWLATAQATSEWNLSNGAAIVVLTPLLITCIRRSWSREVCSRAHVVTLVVTAILAFTGLDSLFAGRGMNFSFLIFPAVIFTAVRFSQAETSLALGTTLLALYVALLAHGREYPIVAIPSLLWFVQVMLWVLAITALLVAALGAERRKAERRSLEATLATEHARLSALRYQINPHFLFNALNSIRSTLPLSETVAREMITSLSGYLRSTLESGDEDRALLHDELESTRKYLHIEKHRFGDDLQICFQIDPDADRALVPAFLLQPLVENAIRHGLEKNRGPCHIVVSASCAAGHLLLTVNNTGIWQPVGKREGMGLANIRRRLRLLYGKAASLQIDSRKENVEVRIALPL